MHFVALEAGDVLEPFDDPALPPFAFEACNASCGAEYNDETMRITTDEGGINVDGGQEIVFMCRCAYQVTPLDVLGTIISQLHKMGLLLIRINLFTQPSQ